LQQQTQEMLEKQICVGALDSASFMRGITQETDNLLKTCGKKLLDQTQSFIEKQVTLNKALATAMKSIEFSAMVFDNARELLVFEDRRIPFEWVTTADQIETLRVYYDRLHIAGF
jgi:hypothetical protein